MKSAAYFAAACLLLLFTTGCPDLKTPEQIADQADESIRPYFPNVHTVALRDQRTIVAFTCSQGTGDALANEVAAVVQSMPQMSDLRKLRTYAAFTGSGAYDTLALAFEGNMVVYDIATGTASTRALNNELRAGYRQACGFEDEETRLLAFIGVWRVQYNLNGEAHTATWVDTLGLYHNEAQFAQNRQDEITNREAIIYGQAASRGCRDIHVSFLAVNHMPVPDRYLAH
jgi:hypothetical protein